MGAILSPSDPEAGRRLSPVRQTMQALQKALDGRYVLEGVLGKGGMGVVYLARETALDRLVALKILPPGVANEDRERFLREAKIAARLKHDNLVPIHTVDHAGPFVYYTMDYSSKTPARDSGRRMVPCLTLRCTPVLHGGATGCKQ